MATGSGFRSYVRHSALTLAFLALMLFSLVGHALSGWRADNEDRHEHGRPPVGLATYVAGPDFLSSLFENWESEFLQMGLFVLLTARLRQKGASESRPIDPSDEEEAPEPVPFRARPWPVRKGGAWRKAYEHSLSAALLLLFVLSFVLHLVSSWRQHAGEALMHGQPSETLLAHLASAQFWFESFQNWQSEFLAVISLVVLSIFLREKDSTESKEVEAPHSRTGA